MNLMGSDEVWAKVVGHEKTFDVSSHGRVRTRKTRLILPQSRDTSGTRYVVLVTGPKRVVRRVGRLVLGAFLGFPAHGQYRVAHRDGDKDNCRLDNVKWKQIRLPWAITRHGNTHRGHAIRHRHQIQGNFDLPIDKRTHVW